ncbi:hypothetical protein [Sphingopyxis macrogoltabida]|uniref:Uncharacterized protein n=1 Tax=Sphingopyxis macrogoltabida TaxID=33050 RepID=A0A0N9UF95_SPHMC|nr:hypothetical protein [Sphingopyxis macrogoltabida]ALH82421.1 hypothetical protein AN936_19290 [Sphingopyxis macrogoltabida]
MNAMPVTAILLLSASAPAATPTPQPTAIAVARARIVSPAEVRRVDGRIEIRTGEKSAPTQVHRTPRRDGGETADFY